VQLESYIGITTGSVYYLGYPLYRWAAIIALPIRIPIRIGI
jgi:hypothetical protein